MGGAVSSGRDNNELVDNLMGSNYIRSRIVERVFRVLDRADYMTPETRDQAYRDLAWRNGPLHLSAPCIYSEVMEGLELRPGISFLNIGSGTGYLSTLAGLIIGSGGISHGIEVHPMVVEYATKKIGQFIENSPTLDEFDFCEPKFFCGNGLCLAPLQAAYDRVYCGAGCPDEYNNYMKQLIKVGGVLVMPLNDNLIQMRRESETEWSSRNLHHVSFATLRVPTKEESGNLLKLDELTPPRLQILARGVVRTCMRKSLQWRHPELREPPPRQQTARPACPRRICIPIEDDSDVATFSITEGLNALHDLDRASGANEMNALLSLVLSMGHNRVAGALRFDSMDSHSDSSSDDDDDGDGDDAPGDDDGSGGGGGADGSGSDGGGGGDGDGGGGRGGGGRGGGGGGPTHRTAPTPRTDTNELSTRTCRGVLTLEFQDAPQPIINVSRQPPDIVINNTDNATVITAGFPKANSSSKTDGTNSKTETDNSKTENGSTSNTDNAIVDSDSADTATETMPPGNDNPKPKGRKSKITLKKSRAETKITKTETDGSKTENRDGNKTENGETKTKPNEPKRKMPAEVEIYLAGKDGVGTSYRTEMDWEDTVEIEIETSGEESTENSKELNQQKMDSGIGEETSPTTTNGSSPEKTEANEDSEMDGPSDSVSDNVDAGIEDRRRQQKRAHGQLGTRSSSSTEAEESGGEGGAGGGGGATSTRRRFKRRATPSVHGPSPSSTVQGPDARRVRLSIMMKRGVKELPLPYALKKYVNLGRCFQF